MKTDARTQYTKKVIRECFFELLKETPLNKITVKGICERAQINRGCISVVPDWVDGGMRETPREVAHFVTRLDEALLTNLGL